MKVISTIRSLRERISIFRAKGGRVGFVPTMGYFHQGHVSLMKASVKDNAVTVVSLFVNPIQFGPKEDLARYPQDIDRDRAMAHEAGVDILFVPSSKEMYPGDLLTSIDVAQITSVLCGVSRPGHFRGVATVVAKLINIVQPDVMYLGQKDAQQVAVIKKMVQDLDFPVKINVAPTIRERDGLAMSSRNVYLSPSQRLIAPRLYQALCCAKRMVADGERDASKIISKIKKLISVGSGASIEYVSCVDLNSFVPVRLIKGKVLVAAAIRVGTTRLIDNIVVKAQ